MSKPNRRSQRKNFLSQKARDREEARFSLDVNTGSEKLRPEDLLQRETPQTVQDAFTNARRWHRENWFVEQVCHLKEGFFNYGLEILPRAKKDKKNVEAFLENDQKAEELHRYIESVISEATLMQTVISLWREEANMTPYLLLPEKCRYTDKMGIEKLWVRLDYKKTDLEDGGLTDAMVRRYSDRNEILLSEEFDEYFHVMTNGLRGTGFGWTRLRRVFRTLSQNESMEVGESMLALAGRLVERTHSIGFEVKSTANAMRQSDYLWKKKRADAIEKFYTGRSGLVDTTRQFDHQTKYIWVDPALYDNRKWMTTIDRLMWWGGPLAFMLMAKQANPSLLVAFIAEVLQFRKQIARHAEYVIGQGFGLPVRLQWSDRCFFDLRLFWDMMKFYTTQGPLSLTTGLKVSGFDPEREAENKRAEAKPERERELVPLWDPHHNKNGKPGDGPGRPKEKN